MGLLKIRYRVSQIEVTLTERKLTHGSITKQFRLHLQPATGYPWGANQATESGKSKLVSTQPVRRTTIRT